MDDLEFASLLCSRICHDLVSPVGAISNGLEVMEDDDHPDTRDHAMSLITHSAHSASAKLQFMRIAFGSARSLGDQVNSEELGGIFDMLMKDGRVKGVWSPSTNVIAKDDAKLLFNLILVGLEALPRGGSLAVSNGEDFMQITCEGDGARIQPELQDMLTSIDNDPAEPRGVVAHLVRRMLDQRGMDVQITSGDNAVSLRTAIA